MTQSPIAPDELVEQSPEATIKSYEPVSGALIGEAPVMSAEQVREVVARARVAQGSWRLLSVEERCRKIACFADLMLERADELVDIIARETGKPRQEALFHGVMATVNFCVYWKKHAPAMLAPEERPTQLLKHLRSVVSYEPRGVAAVISPWNFPLHLPMRDAIPALVAGNAVVVKPSEVTPLTMLKAKEIWDASGMPEDLLGVVTGYGPTGVALLDAGIEFCTFTGSVETGRKVAAACGERLIECVMELGGKAPLLACSDCDIERTAQAIVLGGFINSGQACVAVERVYAHRDIHDQLLERVVELTEALVLGDPSVDHCDIGGITFAPQVELVQAQIEDALAKGATLRAGGRRRDDAVQGFLPTILSGCDHRCRVMTEETFGPIVPFMKVSSEDEALQLANDSHLGLNAYVFTSDSARGRRMAALIEAGTVMINEVVLSAGMTETPFGGVKRSGMGRVYGPEGLRALCNVKHVSSVRLPVPARNPLGFPFSERSYGLLLKGARAMLGSGGLLKRFYQLW